MKRGLGIDVNEAARRRIREVYENFDRVYVAFSGGKDSGVLLNLTVETARELGRLPVDAVHYDFEAWYMAIAEYVGRTMARPEIRPWWFCLPMSEENAVSQESGTWIYWDPDVRHLWTRPMPSGPGVRSDPDEFPWFRKGMFAEEFADRFGAWFAGGESCACLVGIRTDESLNRFRTIASRSKGTWNARPWTTRLANGVVNAYPIYDWRSEDVWTANARFGWDYNHIYDLMALAGVPLREQRLCQPFGPDQRKGLWLYPLLEPETWARVVRRVPGANFGLRHVREDGSVMGKGSIQLPAGFTWEAWAEHLLGSMPPEESARQRARLDRYLSRCAEPDWSAVCRTFLRYDHDWRHLSAADSGRRTARRKALAAKFGNL